MQHVSCLCTCAGRINGFEQLEDLQPHAEMFGRVKQHSKAAFLMKMNLLLQHSRNTPIFTSAVKVADAYFQDWIHTGDTWLLAVKHQVLTSLCCRHEHFILRVLHLHHVQNVGSTVQLHGVHDGAQPTCSKPHISV